MFKEVTQHLEIGYKNKPERLYYNKTKISESIIDETQLKVSSLVILLWVAIESESKEILSITTSKEINMFVVTEHFLSDIVKEYGIHPISTDGGNGYSQSCKFLKLKHHLHSSFEKSIIKITMQYIKDRTIEGFMIIFLAERKKVN